MYTTLYVITYVFIQVYIFLIILKKRYYY